MEEEVIMTYEENTSQPTNEVILTEAAKKHLLLSSKWMMFLSVFNFIILSFAFLACFGISIIPSLTPIQKVLILIIVLLFLGIYFYLNTLLYNCTQKIKNGILLQNGSSIEEAFLKMKCLFKYITVLQIISLVMSLLFQIYFKIP